MVWLYWNNGFTWAFPSALLDPMPDGYAAFDEQATEEQLLAAFPGRAAIVLANKKTSKTAELAAACKAEIEAGYTSAALGTDHTYPSTVVDQLNLHAAILAIPDVATGYTAGFWCETGGEWSFTQHSASELRQAIRDFEAHLQPIQSHWADVSAALIAATTTDDVSAIIW